MPVYSQISYTANGPFTAAAYAARFGGPNKKSGKNVASLKLSTGAVLTEWSDPGQNKHSEAVLLAKVSDLKQIEWLYTERMPCGHGPGLKDCRGLLNANLGSAVPVYFTAPYYEGDDHESEAAAVLGSHFFSSQAPSKTMFNQQAQAWRADIAKSYPMWHSVWAGEIPAHLRAPADLFSGLA